jgi:hypothetical protein
MKELFNKGERQMPEEELQRRGHALRTAIEQRYTELSQKRGLGLHTAITDVVTQYIPVGMSLADAQAIMQNAELECRIVDNPQSPPAVLVGATYLQKQWFGKTQVALHISPQITGDFSGSVGKVYAMIGRVTL